MIETPSAVSSQADSGKNTSRVLLAVVVVLLVVNTVAAVGIWWTISQIQQTLHLQVPPIDIEKSDPL